MPEKDQSSSIDYEKTELTLGDISSKIIEWFKYLYKNWAILLCLAIVGGLLGLIYAANYKPMYTASTSFVLESGEGKSLGAYAGLASVAGIDIASGGDLFQEDNLVELFKSRSMIVKALISQVDINGKRELLFNRYVTIKPAKRVQLLNVKMQRNKSGKLIFSRSEDSLLNEAVQDLRNNYLVVGKPDKKLNIIKVDVKSIDEVFAKLFNNQLVKNVSEFYVETKTKKSIQNVNILQQKVDSVKSVMNGAIYTAASINDATPNLNPTRQLQRVAPVQRSQFTLEVNKLVLGEMVKNLELSKISLRKETPLIQLIDEPVFPLEMHTVSKPKGIFFGMVIFLFFSSLYLVFKR
jgi:uncharacterized protein involved in exopolysaccharide biosynthesis